MKNYATYFRSGHNDLEAVSKEFIIVVSSSSCLPSETFVTVTQMLSMVPRLVASFIKVVTLFFIPTFFSFITTSTPHFRQVLEKQMNKYSVNYFSSILNGISK